MKALCWHGVADVRTETVPDPKLIDPGDAILKVTSTAICGSDLHLFGGFIPNMKKGDILGHEFMGEVVEVGPDVRDLKVGDRVVVPFTIACGRCWFCQHELWSLCDNTNPNHALAEAAYGARSGSGLFGFSHTFGGYAGGQAEYARVPFADVGPVKIPAGMTNEQVLFLSDILPTAYQAAENCNIHKGDVVAVWGCGPVGLLSIACAKLLGAGRVLAIDGVPERLAMARDRAGAEIIDDSKEPVSERLVDLTAGRGPDSAIDAVGLESHGAGSLDGMIDHVKASIGLATDRLHALRQAIHSVRKGGTVSIPGAYGGLVDKFPLGAAFSKGLTFKMGQTHVQRYLRPLLQRIERGEIDPSFIITHRITLDDVPEMYKTFRDKKDGCVKCVIHNS